MSNAETIDISVVTFKVLFNPLDSGLTAEEALLQIFAFTKPLRLVDERLTRLQYACGNYDQQSNGVWTGQIEAQRTTMRSAMVTDQAKGNRFVNRELGHTEAITTMEDWSTYAYDPRNETIAYRDRASIPFTRLASFVEKAASAYEGSEFTIKLVPEKSDMTLAQIIDHFTRLTSISIKYRHSQSPGNAFVDDIIDSLNAHEAVSTAKAKKGESLDKKNLVKGKNPFAQVINHIEKNPKNGEAGFAGFVEQEQLRIRSRNPIARRRVEATDSPQGHAMAVAGVVATKSRQGE